MARTKSQNSSKNGVDRALSAIREGIVEGRFAPGQRLIEIDLMNEMEVSRGNIREAFRILESESIVNIEKNRGASVRKISKQEIRDTFEVLEITTQLAIAKVAERYQQPEVQKALEESLSIARQFDTEINQHSLIQDYMKENTRFWGILGRLAGNPILEATRSRLQLPLLRLHLPGLVVRSHRSEWITYHIEILLALLDGDAKKAREFTIKAQRDVLTALLSLPESAYF